MKQTRLKFATKEDSPRIAEWILSNHRNGFDGSILEYPTCQYLCCYDDDGPISYLPTQKAVVLESVAPRPGIDPVKAAQALRDMVKGASLEASSHGIREIYMVGTDPKVVELARTAGFEELPWPVLRLKLS